MAGRVIGRRQFLAGVAAAPWLTRRHCAAAPFPVRFRKPAPHETLAPYILPGNDEFPGEKTAMEIVAALRRIAETRSVPLATDFRGSALVAARYRQLAP